MQWRQLTPWIIVSVLVCAAFGAWFGHRLGDGGSGNIALISATCAVLGSFVPGGVARIWTRLRGGRPHQGPA